MSMGVYERDVVVVIKISADIHEVFIILILLYIVQTCANQLNLSLLKSIQVHHIRTFSSG